MAEDSAPEADQLEVTSAPETFAEWDFPEYPKRRRTKRWWAVAAIVWGALAVASAVSGSFLFLLILLFAAIIFLTQERREPGRVVCAITEDGVDVDGRQYEYRDLEGFFIIYEPPEVKMLYLNRRGWRPHLGIPLEDQDPTEVREALLRFLPEDVEREHEPLLDQLTRLLGLHW